VILYEVPRGSHAYGPPTVYAAAEDRSGLFQAPPILHLVSPSGHTASMTNDAANVPCERRPMSLTTILGLATVFLLLSASAKAQHLGWNLEGQKDGTCLYGQITVLATNPSIYDCGANWHPGEPAGGYCGIQHNGEKERRTIFSIWDTSPSLHPNVTEADPKTIFNRSGGGGEGSHTHMLWDWRVGQPFDFLVRKETGKGDTTDTRYDIYDRIQRWFHSATITSPNGGKRSVATIGGRLNSFLENFTGQDRAAPKLALYRLWLGKDIDKMTFLTRAGGDGTGFIKPIRRAAMSSRGQRGSDDPARPSLHLPAQAGCAGRTRRLRVTVV